MLTLDDIFGRLEAMGYNQAAIARRLNTSEANISRWRKGVHQPTPDVIEALAELARLNPATVAVVVMASRAGKSRKAWERAYGELARAGLAAVAGVAVISDCILCKAPKAQEDNAPASRRSRQLSGWLKNHQPALYVIWGIQHLTRRTLLRLWHWRSGYSALSREGLLAASWPMLA